MIMKAFGLIMFLKECINKYICTNMRTVTLLILCITIIYGCTSTPPPSSNVTKIDTLPLDTPTYLNTEPISSIMPDTQVFMDEWRVLTPNDIVDDSLLADGTLPSSWNTANIHQPDELKLFIKKISYFLEVKMIDSLVKHIKFPTKNNTSKADFTAQKDKILTPEIIQAFINTRSAAINRTKSGVIILKNKAIIKNTSTNKAKDQYQIILI